MDDRNTAKCRNEIAYRALLESIRDRALRFLQVAPAMERRGEIQLLSRTSAISACEPEICSIELATRTDTVTVRCHTCKRGGLWRIPEQESPYVECP